MEEGEEEKEGRQFHLHPNVPPPPPPHPPFSRKKKEREEVMEKGKERQERDRTTQYLLFFLPSVQYCTLRTYVKRIGETGA